MYVNKLSNHPPNVTKNDIVSLAHNVSFWAQKLTHSVSFWDQKMNLYVSF